MRAQVDGARARLWAGAAEAGPLRRVGPELDLSELSDDFGPRLRFTGAFAGISAVDLLEGAFTADFSDWSLACVAEPLFRRPRPPLGSLK
jgi:xylan 1,4-beta-xylosidase